MRTTAERWALLQPLAVRDFRLLWLGESVSVFGTQFHLVAMPWLVLQLTGSGLALGTVLMTSAIPRAVFMLAGGAFTDRFAPRALMLWANGWRGALMIVLASLIATGHVVLWHVYVIAGVFGIADAFFYPAYVSMTPHLLPPARLASGNALLQGTVQFAGLVGPAMGGVVVAAAGIAYAFAIDAASFFFSFVMIALIAGARADAAPQAPHDVLHSIREGLQYAWGDRLIRAFLLMTAGVNFAFVGPFFVGSAILARDVFGGPAALGAMFASFGGGAFVGALIAGAWAPRRRGWLMIGLMALVAGGLFGFAFAPNVWFASAVLVVVGITGGLANVVTLTFLQRRAEERMRGRVMSVVMLNAVGLTPFSFVVAGAVVEASLVGLFAGAGSLVLLLTVYVALRTPLRELD